MLGPSWSNVSGGFLRQASCHRYFEATALIAVTLCLLRSHWIRENDLCPADPCVVARSSAHPEHACRHTVGGSRARHFDAHIIAASNRDLWSDVIAGRFRKDLYYRVAVFPIAVPSLRERIRDIIPLAEHFLALHQRAEDTANTFTKNACRGDQCAVEPEPRRIAKQARKSHPLATPPSAHGAHRWMTAVRRRSISARRSSCVTRGVSAGRRPGSSESFTRRAVGIGFDLVRWYR